MIAASRKDPRRVVGRRRCDFQPSTVNGSERGGRVEEGGRRLLKGAARVSRCMEGGRAAAYGLICMALEPIS